MIIMNKNLLRQCQIISKNQDLVSLLLPSADVLKLRRQSKHQIQGILMLTKKLKLR